MSTQRTLDEWRRILISKGYGEILAAAQSMVAQVRFDHKTNDIAILAFIEPEKPGECRLLGTTRSIAQTVLRENFPQAENTLAFLGQPVAPTSFPFFLSDGGTFYGMELECLHETGGVLN